MNNKNLENRNFNTISPSAIWILLMKGHTNIPFAQQTAELIQHPKTFTPDFTKKDMTFWARTLHFESRYLSIDSLLDDLKISNILELSSGYSFRGLDKVRNSKLHYIDTDLPAVIETKKEFIKALQTNMKNMQGELELLSLNALNEDQFRDTVNRFPSGEIVIVNEGLLMYLDSSEKEKLCRIIHNILEERGGYWITADIYLKHHQEKLNFKVDDRTKEFFEEHQIEEKRFESFSEAEEFFKKMGFTIDKEADIDITKLGSFRYLCESSNMAQLTKMSEVGKFQATWRLKVSDN